MQKQIEQLTFDKMREILFDGKSILDDNAFMGNDFAMLHGKSTYFKRLLPVGTPFRIDDTRIGFIRQGVVRNVVNLQKHEIGANTIAFLGKGSILELREASADLQLSGLAFQDDLLGNIGGMPAPFNGELQDFFIENASTEEMEMMESLFDTLWKLLHQPRISKEAIGGMTKAVVFYLSGLYHQRQLNQPQAKTNDRDIFDRFIRLVNTHCKTERQIAFYADKLFLSPRYISHVVKHVSGISAKEWIDRSIVTQAKVMLKHSPMRVVQIAYELNFPNPSFFNRYFKQHTGMTPKEYRNS